MDSKELRDIAERVLGTAEGWQSAIARRLRVDVRTVVRWVAADRVPEAAAKRVKALIDGGKSKVEFDPGSLVILKMALGDAIRIADAGGDRLRRNRYQKVADYIDSQTA